MTSASHAEDPQFDSGLVYFFIQLGCDEWGSYVAVRPIFADIAQLGERQTEDLKVPGSIPGVGTALW